MDAVRRLLLKAAGAGAVGALATRPVAAQGVHRIAWLSSTRANHEIRVSSFVDGLAAYGYEVGRNLTILEGWGNDSFALTESLAADLVAAKPSVLVTQGPALMAAAKVAGGIPIVFAFSGDPVAAGVARSLARPGGNCTGLSFLALDLVAKRVDTLHEIVPQARRLAIVASPNHPGDKSELEVSRGAAAKHGMISTYHGMGGSDSDRDAALQSVLDAKAEVLVLHPNAGMMRHREAFARFGIQHRIPMAAGWSYFAEAGSLFSYGPKLDDGFARLGYFVDRILKGARPAELPIELPRAFELVLNQGTARKLGLTFPRTVAARADRVID